MNYGEGLMPTLEQIYNDEQLARVRKDIADRKTPWAQDELKALGKSKPGK